MGFNPIRATRKFFRDVKNAPEAQYVTSTAAETQFPSQLSLVVPEKAHYLETGSRTLTGDFSHRTFEDDPSLPPRPAKKQSSGALDKVVKAAGSRWALAFVLALLITWGVLGGVFGATDTWQVLLQDVSSLQAYASATLLMRQQNTNTRALLSRICGLISRSKSNERMVRSLTPEQRNELRTSSGKLRADVLATLQVKEDTFDKVSNAIAKASGSLVALGIYTAAIIAWVFLGIPAGFSDTWQLWVNTGTALEITFVTMFLQNIRQEHENHMEETVKTIERLDKDVEMQLRRMTGDMTPNPTINSEPLKLNSWEKGIDIYAFIIGGSIGITISAIVLALWLSVGDYLEFDDNWWLIIGTYTGLIGFVDGFILKNVDAREGTLAAKHFNELVEQDHKIFSLIGVEAPMESKLSKRSLNQRISAIIGHWVESTTASYMSIFAVFALVITASAMQWTETGQLLCNTPTMIFEGFMLITLLQAHNEADEVRRMVYDDILTRRLVMDKHLSAFRDDTDSMSINEKDGAFVQTFEVNGVDVEMGRSF